MRVNIGLCPIRNIFPRAAPANEIGPAANRAQHRAGEPRRSARGADEPRPGLAGSVRDRLPLPPRRGGNRRPDRLPLHVQGPAGDRRAAARSGARESGDADSSMLLAKTIVELRSSVRRCGYPISGLSVLAVRCEKRPPSEVEVPIGYFFAVASAISCSISTRAAALAASNPARESTPRPTR